MSFYSEGSSILVVSRWLWPRNRTLLEVASMVFTWWILFYCAVLLGLAYMVSIYFFSPTCYVSCIGIIIHIVPDTSKILMSGDGYNLVQNNHTKTLVCSTKNSYGWFQIPHCIGYWVLHFWPSWHCTYIYRSKVWIYYTQLSINTSRSLRV